MKVSDALLETAQAGEHAALEMINVWSHSAAGQTGGNRVPGQWIMGGSMRLLERTMAPLYTDFNACNQYAAGRGERATGALSDADDLGQERLMTPPAQRSRLQRSWRT